MADNYDFQNLSPIEFEALCVDLVSAVTGLRFESFSEGADGGIDGRHSTAEGNLILQAKHYKNSNWNGLKKAAKEEGKNLASLEPSNYYFATSQGLTPSRKDELKDCLEHNAVQTKNIWGRTELNACLMEHPQVEKRHIKLWLSSSAVLERLLHNDIAIFTVGTCDDIERILKVYVANPSLSKAANILEKKHCLIISGPPGVGKTTLAQVLAAEYCDDEWELVAVTSIDEAFRCFNNEKKQVFIFDDFLGKIRLDGTSLAKDDSKIARFFSMVGKRSNKRFVLTTRSYILEAARNISEFIDDKRIDLTELTLNLSMYTREIRARILYNHLYHSEIPQEAIQELLSTNTVQKIVDHPNYMPRIIEWMTDQFEINDIHPDEYSERFLSALHDPRKIWEKAFSRHISLSARILLYCTYLSKFERFISPGVHINVLEPFFTQALPAFEINQNQLLQTDIFEETLREIKSSFVVIDKDKVMFINPSVQDFLSSAIENENVLCRLAASVPTFENANTLWSEVKRKYSDGTGTKARVATFLINAIRSGQLSGKMVLHELANLVGELAISSGQLEFLQFIREGGLLSSFWTNKAELPHLIYDLSEGKFSHLPHAPAYAQLLRRRLFNYLSHHEYVLEIEELGNLAENLITSSVEFSERFHEVFEEAVGESLDILDVNFIPIDENMEFTIGQCLESIEKIENYSPSAVDGWNWKKSDLEEFLHGIELQAEMQMEESQERSSLQRSASSTSSLAIPGSPIATELSERQFTNDELSTMFSSLKSHRSV